MERLSGPSETGGRECRGRRRAQRRQQAHLADQQRITRRYVGEHAEGDDRLLAETGIAGMTVDELEAVELRVRDRHQLDHPTGRVAREARGEIELGPAQEIGAQFVDEATQDRLRSLPA
ncbi:hypothetical protein M2437_003953 [Methylorubrum pseudosasae]|nr:hypothetical protein [Methylorubrum pseudosasae]